MPEVQGRVSAREVAEGYRSHVNRTLAMMMGRHAEVSASGSRVYDESGTEYLECGGYGVFLLGHRHPRVVDAVVAQINQQPLPTRLLLSPPLARAAQALADVAPAGLEYVYLTNSGTEATELAIKLARLHGKRRIITMERGFHGLSMGSLSVTDNDRWHESFAPLMPGVSRVPFGEAAALEAELSRGDGDACVVLEPIQGEGGVVMPPPGYLSEVGAICRSHDAFLVVDEIQTGLGRAGAWWQTTDDVKPQVVLAGKALSGGIVPVGAVLSTPAAYEPLNRDPFLHGSTYANSPIQAAAVAAAVQTIDEQDAIAAGRRRGFEIKALLERILQAHCASLVTEVRGRGLLIGVEFKAEHHGGEFLLQLFEHRVIAKLCGNDNRVVRFTPSAFIDDRDIEWLADAVEQSAKGLAAAFPDQRDWNGKD